MQMSFYALQMSFYASQMSFYASQMSFYALHMSGRTHPFTAPAVMPSIYSLDVNRNKINSGMVAMI